MKNPLIWQHAYLTTLYLAAAISLAITVYAWMQRARPGSLLFSFMMLAVSAYTLTAGLMSSAATPEGALSWVHWHYFSLTSMVALYICFIFQFTGNARWINRYTLPVIILMPILTQIIIETNPIHHWFLQDIAFSKNGILMGLSTIVYGGFFWVHTIYSYSLVLLGMGMLVVMSVRSFWIYKAQFVTLLIAVFFPLLGSINDSKVFFSGIPYPIVPLCFTVMGLLLAWNLYRNKMLNIIPVARDMLIESMSDCLFVLDLSDHLIDINSSAIQLFNLEKEDLIGKTSEQLLLNWPQTFNRFRGVYETQGDISIVHNGEQLFFDMKVSPVLNKYGKTIGKMVILRDITQRVFAQLELQDTLKRVNELKEELYRHSIRDPLTSMYNRRYLEEIFPRELANADRAHTPISFVMMDIDHFKIINDTYGHLVGDQVLLALSAFFREHIRVGDLIFRYGGEEFLALLINSDAEAARQIAERWQKELANQNLKINGNLINITLSIGIAEYGRGNISGHEVIHAADMALYQAKDNGRNCISVYDSPSIVEP
jgi:diguanylate cyclase (GGDEF)-like protein/PAS domain S-box-containing protein